MLMWLCNCSCLMLLNTTQNTLFHSFDVLSK